MRFFCSRFLKSKFIFWWICFSTGDHQVMCQKITERHFWISWPFLSVSLSLIKLKRFSITVHSCLLRWAYSQAGWLTVSLYISSLAMTSRVLWKGPLFCARFFHCVLWNTDNLKIKQRTLNARRKTHSPSPSKHLIVERKFVIFSRWKIPNEFQLISWKHTVQVFIKRGLEFANADRKRRKYIWQTEVLDSQQMEECQPCSLLSCLFVPSQFFLPMKI